MRFDGMRFDGMRFDVLRFDVLRFDVMRFDAESQRSFFEPEIRSCRLPVGIPRRHGSLGHVAKVRAASLSWRLGGLRPDLARPPTSHNVPYRTQASTGTLCPAAFHCRFTAGLVYQSSLAATDFTAVLRAPLERSVPFPRERLPLDETSDTADASVR